MDFLVQALTDWLKEILVGGIMGNLSGMFNTVNQKVGEISTQVGLTPQAWNGDVFNMVQNLSETLMVPIAGVILAFVMTMELIQLIVDKNNFHDIESAVFFKWIFKSACAILIVTNTWDIVMGIFDLAQGVVSNASGVIIGDAAIDISSVTADLEARLMEMDLGPLFGLWFQSLFVGITIWALVICIFLVTFGRMIEIYLVTSIAPIPMATHDYDEYHYDLGEIGHDPYVLISLLTAYHQGAWTLEQVQPTLEMLFDRQYHLTESVVPETRYDADDEPYTYYICYVTLEVTDLSHLPVYIMGEDQLSMYATYMATLGNRPDLFPQDQYPGASVVEDYLDYDVPPEALEDEQFAAMLAEAEKYLGFPYVWGGSSPSTSFDCSGFVSWVINHSGWDVGRLGAQSLFNLCTPVSAANAKPGDLVFFTGTYDSGTPVSHCGIYVGNGMMIHAGSPISYADLSSSYWQEHLYSYARLP